MGAWLAALDMLGWCGSQWFSGSILCVQSHTMEVVFPAWVWAIRKGIGARTALGLKSPEVGLHPILPHCPKL